MSPTRCSGSTWPRRATSLRRRTSISIFARPTARNSSRPACARKTSSRAIFAPRAGPTFFSVTAKRARRPAGCFQLSGSSDRQVHGRQRDRHRLQRRPFHIRRPYTPELLETTQTRTLRPWGGRVAIPLRFDSLQPYLAPVRIHALGTEHAASTIARLAHYRIQNDARGLHFQHFAGSFADHP